MDPQKTANELAHYLTVLMSSLDRDSERALVLVKWLKENSTLVDFDVTKALTREQSSGGKGKPCNLKKHLPVAVWRNVLAQLRACANETAASSDKTSENLKALSGALELDDLSAKIFALIHEAGRCQPFRQLAKQIIRTGGEDMFGFIAGLLQASYQDVWHAMTRGVLLRYELINVYGDGTRDFDASINYEVRIALRPPSDGLGDIEAKLVGAPVRATLDLADFSYLTRELGFIVNLLRSAFEDKTRGVNILLYGPPGTGKTELCKTIAETLGVTLYAVGEIDEDGEEPGRYDRVCALQRAVKLTARRDSTLLLFDEMEDLQNGGDVSWTGDKRIRRAGSKVFFNRLLETNATPILWAANEVADFDPAFIRRMSFALEVKPAPSGSRETMWRKLAKDRGLDLPDAGARQLARAFAVAPATMKSAADAVTASGGSVEDITFALKSLTKPLGAPLHRQAFAHASPFDLTLVNADMDLACLQTSLSKPDTPVDISLCLYGAPGTGKSAWARHLADAMGFDVLEKRASDLMSKWVGETEQAIAEMFDEATRERKFLIIDEAEALFWSRDAVERSWQMSQVNEFLVALERHPLPFVATTNHLERIDAAIIRRLIFKVNFDFLTRTQIDAAYAQFFGREAPPEVRRLQALTPGDFAATARRLKFMLPDMRTDKVIVPMLEKEISLKPGLGKRIGY